MLVEEEGREEEAAMAPAPWSKFTVAAACVF